MLALLLTALAGGAGVQETARSDAFTTAIATAITTEWGARVVCGPTGLAFDDAEGAPLPLGPDAPRGRPVGIVVDRGARVWIATESAFGVVDLRGVFARTLRRAAPDELGAFRSLERAADGALELRGEHGTWRYLPDAGEPPQLVLGRAEGRVLEPGANVQVGADGVLDLDLELSGRGAVELAWRKRDEHAWHALAPAESSTCSIAGLGPGAHELVLAAVDDDLRRTTLWFAVDVARPRWTYLGTVGVAALPLLLFGAALLARRATSRARERALVGALTLLVVGQVFAAVSTRTRGWPFVGFAMFREVVAAEALVERPRLLALCEDGREVHVEWTDPAARRRALVQDLTAAIDGDELAAARALATLRAGPGGARFVGFRVRSERARLTPDGPRELAPVELVLWREPDARR